MHFNIDNGNYNGNYLRDRQCHNMDYQAYEISLDIRFLQLGFYGPCVVVSYYVFFLALDEHVTEPLFPHVLVEVQLERAKEDKG